MKTKIRFFSFLAAVLLLCSSFAIIGCGGGGGGSDNPAGPQVNNPSGTQGGSAGGNASKISVSDLQLSKRESLGANEQAIAIQLPDWSDSGAQSRRSLRGSNTAYNFYYAYIEVMMFGAEFKPVQITDNGQPRTLYVGKVDSEKINNAIENNEAPKLVYKRKEDKNNNKTLKVSLNKNLLQNLKDAEKGENAAKSSLICVAKDPKPQDKDDETLQRVSAEYKKLNGEFMKALLDIEDRLAQIEKRLAATEEQVGKNTEQLNFINELMLIGMGVDVDDEYKSLLDAYNNADGAEAKKQAKEALLEKAKNAKNEQKEAIKQEIAQEQLDAFQQEQAKKEQEEREKQEKEQTTQGTVEDTQFDTDSLEFSEEEVESVDLNPEKIYLNGVSGQPLSAFANSNTSSFYSPLGFEFAELSGSEFVSGIRYESGDHAVRCGVVLKYEGENIGVEIGEPVTVRNVTFSVDAWVADGYEELPPYLCLRVNSPQTCRFDLLAIILINNNNKAYVFKAPDGEYKNFIAKIDGDSSYSSGSGSSSSGSSSSGSSGTTSSTVPVSFRVSECNELTQLDEFDAVSSSEPITFNQKLNLVFNENRMTSAFIDVEGIDLPLEAADFDLAKTTANVVLYNSQTNKPVNLTLYCGSNTNFNGTKISIAAASCQDDDPGCNEPVDAILFSLNLNQPLPGYEITIESITFENNEGVKFVYELDDYTFESE